VFVAKKDFHCDPGYGIGLAGSQYFILGFGKAGTFSPAVGWSLPRAFF
jgi:hypothetical protein